MDWAHHAIVDLIDHLERKKDEAIQFTFRQVGVGTVKVCREWSLSGWWDVYRHCLLDGPSAVVWFLHHAPCPASQVSSNFTEIFEELAPGGTGRLEMKLREMTAVSTRQHTLAYWPVSSQLVPPCRTPRAVPVGPRGWRTLLTCTRVWPYRWGHDPTHHHHTTSCVQ